MKNIQIEEEIQDLLGKLQTWEDIDPLYTHEETKEIRHKIFHIHARTEISLEILLANHLLYAVDNKSVSKEERQKFYHRFTKIIANTDFYKKIVSVESESLLEGKLIGKIKELNRLRVVFAHPSAYQDEIREYAHDLTKQLKTLKLLESVYEGLNSVFAKSMGMTEKQKEDLSKIHTKSQNKIRRENNLHFKPAFIQINLCRKMCMILYSATSLFGFELFIIGLTYLQFSMDFFGF